MTNTIPFLIYIVVTTFTPGPNNILSMSNGVHDGYRKTIPFLAGICSGFFIIMLTCGLINLTLQAFIPSVEPWLQVLGALYMVYLAIYILRSKPADDASHGSGLNTFRAGFIMQFLNVKVILYGTTVYSLFIIHTYHDVFSIAVFALVLTMVGFMAISCWAVGGNLLKTYLQTHSRVFNLVLAGLLLYTAAAGFFGVHG